MSKYCFNINGIDTCTTHGKVLDKIGSNSLVLECGSSSGYMTKFMRDSLGCTVHIIEKNKYDYISASQYAAKSCLGDLNNLSTLDEFKEYKYDFILFADVLEHLYNPIAVLQKASELLQPTGKIVISFPNICHNDILINMFYDHWMYRNLGLLDDTHIRFAGMNDIDKWIDSVGLKIVERDYKIIPTQCTEQRYYGDVDSRLLALLKERPNGEIYQFVLVCQLK